MENKKVIETIEKKLEAKVDKVNEVVQNGKEVTADVDMADGSSRKVVLKEMRNQYGTYYRFVSESKYTKVTEKVVAKAEKKAAAKLRTKTERLCGARRKDIISLAERIISSLADGTATLKEIEGPAKEDTAIRFVLILNEDGSRVKEDIEVSTIRESICAV